MTTPEGKVKQWCRRKDGAFDRFFPGHLRIAPHGGSFSVNGVSDDILCWRGVFVAIEIKPDDGHLTRLQREFLKEVVDAGGVGALLRGKDEVRLANIRDKVLEVANGFRSRDI
jgi:hypothetical protein